MGAEHLALMARREITPLLTPSARTLAERLERFVSSTTRKLAPRIDP